MTKGQKEVGVETGAVSTLHSKLQEKRRAAALERQKHARHRQMHMARHAVSSQVVAPSHGAGADTTPQLMAGADSSAGIPVADSSTMEATQQQPSSSGAARRRQRHRHATKRAQHGQHTEPSSDQMQEEVSEEVEDEYMSSAGGLQQGASTQHQLQLPEWMTDVPADVATHWLVLPRPEGPRCIVTTSRGYTVVRTKGGSILFSAHTALPEGGPCSLGGAKDFCVLDAVWHKPNNTLYILDLLVWRGYALTDCGAEFRAYWLQSKFSEDPNMVAGLLNPPGANHMDASTQHTQQGPHNQVPEHIMESDSAPISSGDAEAAPVIREEDMAGTQATSSRPHGAAAAAGGGGGGGHEATHAAHPWVRVVSLPVLPASPDGLATAYQGGCTTPASREFQQDGLYFLHKESMYCEGGSTPLALSWKDAGCSAWPIDTDAQGGPLAHQVVTLTYRMDCTVATDDDPPVVLGTMPLAWVQAMGPKLLQPGRLLRFSIKERGLLWAPDGRPAGADLHYEGPASRRRGRADCFSKILFQQMARTQPLTWQHILLTAHQGMHAASAPAKLETEAILHSHDAGMADE